MNLKKKYFKKLLMAFMFLCFVNYGCDQKNNPLLPSSTATPVVELIVNPEIIEVSPKDESKEVEINTAVRVIFSKEMDSATINNITFTLKDAAEVAGTVSYIEESKTAVFIPLNNLFYNTQYIVEITAEVKDKEKKNLEFNFNWKFITLQDPDRPIPADDPLHAPSGITTALQEQDITITWKSVPHASSYNLYYGITSGVTKITGTKLASVGSPYTHTKLEEGTNYYYILTAVAGQEESVESAEVSQFYSSGEKRKNNPVFYSDPALFQSVVTVMGTPAKIDFEDGEACPGDTIEGCADFNFEFYIDKGVSFSNSSDYPFFIAKDNPTWNTTKSLSVGRFPLDSKVAKGEENDDSLSVVFTNPVRAAGMEIINGSKNRYAEFIDTNGKVIMSMNLPDEYIDKRRFIGVVAVDESIKYIKIVDINSTEEDMAYDNIVFYPENNGPSGSILINADESVINTTVVDLTLTCSSSKECSEMHFSNDNITYSDTELFAVNKKWELSPGEETKTVYVKYKDKAGNWSTVIKDSIILDTTPPSGTITINSNVSLINSLAVTLTLTCSDANGCVQMQFSHDDKTFSEAENFAINKNWTLSTEGETKTVYVKYKDKAGNWSNSLSDSILLDTTVPTGSVVIDGDEPLTNSLSSILTLACIDSEGCVQMKFSNDNQTFSEEEVFSFSKNWTLASEGDTKTVYVKFKDAAGNWSPEYKDSILMDTVVPTGSIVINSGLAATNTLASLLTLTCTDANGCDQMQFSHDDKTYSDEENYSNTKNWNLNPEGDKKIVYVKFKDAAGNWSKVYQAEIGFISVAMIGTIKINSGAVYSTAAAVTLNLTCTDVNPCKEMRFSNDNSTWSDPEIFAPTKSWTLSDKDGSKTVYVMFKSQAGNWSSAYPNTTILDTTAPAGSIKINNTAGTTLVSGVTLTLTCTDTNKCTQMQFANDNGTYSTAENFAATKNWTLSTKDGAKTVSVKFKDTAGNWSSPVSDTITMDSTGPTGSIVIDNKSGYTKSTTVTLTLTCSDTNACKMALSNDGATWSKEEIFAATKTWTITSGDGTKTVSVKFKDAAGNWSAVIKDTIALDTAPATGSISINNKAAYLSKSTATLTLTCKDTVGCDKMTFSNDKTTWSTEENYATTKSWTLSAKDGVKTVWVKFKDKTGKWSALYSDSTTVDATEPTGSISINKNAKYISTTVSSLTLSCTDANGCALMMFSNDNTTWSKEETYVTTKAWTLIAGEGNKTVYVKYKDKAGNMSSVSSTSIKLDAAGPTGSIWINNKAADTTSTSVSLTLTCVDPGSDCALMKFSNDGTTWSTEEKFNVGPKTWTLSTAKGVKTVYVKYKDNSGQWSNNISDTITLK